MIEIQHHLLDSICIDVLYYQNSYYTLVYEVYTSTLTWSLGLGGWLGRRAGTKGPNQLRLRMRDPNLLEQPRPQIFDKC